MASRRKFIKQAGLLSISPVITSINPTSIATEHPKIIKPKALKTGDTIAITSPAGAVWDTQQIEVFSSILKQLGFNVVLGKTLSEKWGYFSGKEETRVNELHEFFSNKNIQGIFSMKGGWGCARLLDLLDYDLIRKNPKVILGFSDISSLLIAIHQRCGLITFHGPVGNSGWNDFTSSVFRSVVQKNISDYIYPAPPSNEDPIVTLSNGKASGELIGGNLTVLTNLIGSHYLPDWKGKLLFIEDFKEEPYSIDRMLTQLKLSGVLDKVNGVIIGKCNKCVPEEPLKSFTLIEVLEQHFKAYGKPAFYGAMIGHIENKYTVPIGIKAEMDADKGSIRLLENSVQ